MKSSLTLQRLSEFLSEYWELIKKSRTADLSWEGLKQETDRRFCFFQGFAYSQHSFFYDICGRTLNR